MNDQPMVTMIECPVCGVPIQAAKEHVCDYITKLHYQAAMYRAEQEEIDNLRSRCESLEWDCDQLLAMMSAGREAREKLILSHAEQFDRAEAAEFERDEARRWARKLYRENADLRHQPGNWKHDIAQAAYNKALDEVDHVVSKRLRAYWSMEVGVYVTRGVREAITSLKEK